MTPLNSDGHATDPSGNLIEACSVEPPETMFPNDGEDLDPDDPLVKAAKGVCGSCAFRIACGEGAVARREPFGIWGGLTRKEREALRRRRARAATKRRRAAEQAAKSQPAPPAVHAITPQRESVQLELQGVG